MNNERVAIFIAPGTYTNVNITARNLTLWIIACDTSLNSGTGNYLMGTTKTVIRKGETSPIKRTGKVIFQDGVQFNNWIGGQTGSFNVYFQGSSDSLEFKMSQSILDEGVIMFAGGTNAYFNKCIFNINNQTMQYGYIWVSGYTLGNSLKSSETVIENSTFKNCNQSMYYGFLCVGNSLGMMDNHTTNIKNCNFININTPAQIKLYGGNGYIDLRKATNKFNLDIGTFFRGVVQYDTAYTNITSNTSYFPHVFIANGKTQYVSNSKMSIWNNAFKYTGIDSSRSWTSGNDSIKIKVNVNGIDYWLKLTK